MIGFRKLTMLGLALLAGVLALTVDTRPVQAHGERTQEPFFRMRSMQWYDVNWSKTEVNVGEDWVLTGKFYVMKDWPESIAQPDLVFVSLLSPGPVFARINSSLNGVPARQSFKDLELGKVYDYKVTLRGRIPGRYHIHPEMAVHTAGPLVGPGEWIETKGSADDFTLPLETMTGNKIPDLQTFGVMTVGIWHIIWVVIAAAWLLFWLLRPLLIPRWIALNEGHEDLLIRRADVVAGALLAVVSVGLVITSYVMGVTNYPVRVPLQITVNTAPEIEQPPQDIKIKLDRATYDVPGRAMRLTFEATNTGNATVTLGEFTTSSLRFINMDSPVAMSHVDPNYPQEWIPKGGLSITNPSPLQPGETRTFDIQAVDVAWEIERLTSFMTDVDARFGGLLFFYEADGKRHLSEISGPILPVFTGPAVASDKAGTEVAATSR